jgi:hypothetical protein
MARCHHKRFSARPIKENAALRDARAQRQLIEFLRTDLELAQIFVDSARQQLKMGDLEDYGELLSQAAKAIDSIQYFGETISDQHIREEIQNKLERLENHLIADRDEQLTFAKSLTSVVERD